MNRIKTIFAAGALAVASLCAHAESPDSPDFWTTPTIQGHGKMHYLPNGAFKPQANRTYKIVFDMTSGPAKPDEVDPALDHVARAVNLYVAAGVPLSHLKFVAVAHGKATPLVLDDEHYRAAFGVANPNLPLIADLKKAGVIVAVCGQGAAEYHYDYAWIDKSVTLTYSALTTVANLQQAGYAYVPL
jgi:intracellular sulfur oxidation DsrE/DsrF family protein